MHPETAKTLVEQRHEQLVQCQAASKRERYGSAGCTWLGRHVPRWHISWSRMILSPAGGPGRADSGSPDRPGRRGSSLVIIISAHRSA
jgi:hypothetical protein